MWGEDMCGRVLLESDFNDILKSFFIEQNEVINFKKGEGFPGDSLPVVVNKEKKKVDVFSWGFIVNDKRIINARCETILEKPLFKNAFISNRCLVPVNGFYEWKRDGNKKVKHKIALKGEEIFSLAGIYRDFIDRDGVIKRCVMIITTEPNLEMSSIHNRMPVIVDKCNEELYLENKFSNGLLELLKPIENGRLEISRVDKLEYENISFF